jgi:hypothetical protein
MIMNAATHGPVPFDRELVRWLRIDSTARARAKTKSTGSMATPISMRRIPVMRISRSRRQQQVERSW